MDDVMRALTPVVVCGIALQQLLELLDPVLQRAGPNKPWITSALALAAALATTAGVGLRLLGPLGLPQAGVFDLMVTALIMTAGTRGANDLLKWLGYKKAAARRAAVGPSPRAL